jgi:hypothetical protein
MAEQVDANGESMRICESLNRQWWVVTVDVDCDSSIRGAVVLIFWSSDR